MISDKGNLLLAKKQISTFVLKLEIGSPSMTVTPEDIERAAATGFAVVQMAAWAEIGL